MVHTFLHAKPKSIYMLQVRDENKEAEYLCLSHNPFADFIAVGTDNGTIKVYDEKTLQVSYMLTTSSSVIKTHFINMYLIL